MLGEFPLADHLVALPPLDGGEQRIEAPLRVRHLSFGLGEHGFANPQPAGDRDAVGPARNPLDQPVGRAQRRRVELQRGVHDPRRGGGEPLERAQVRGREGHGAAPGERLERGPGERRPLRGVGAAPHFVEENERGVVRLLEDHPELGDVGAEGRKAGGDGLPVADIREQPREHRQPAAGTHRRDESALRQRHVQPDRLEQHRFAAGVGAGEENALLVALERQVEWHDRLSLGEQQWVASIHDHQIGRGARHGWRVAIGLDGPLGPGDEIVDGHAHRVQRPHLGDRGPEQIGEIAEDLQFLAHRARLCLTQGVAERDDGGGLDVQRGAAGGLAVNDPVGTVA